MNEEKTRKLLLIFIVLLFFGCTYYYYGSGKPLEQPKTAENLNDKTNNKIKPDRHAELVSAAIPQTTKTLVPKQQTLKQVQDDGKVQKEAGAQIKTGIIETKAKPQKTTETKYKPTDKSYLASLSAESSGKSDPFSYKESRCFSPNQNSENGAIPPISGIQDLPTLPTLPGSSQAFDMPPTPKPEEPVVIKGFIGNKVIAKVNGVVEALSENQEVNNVKVLSINPSTSTVKFEINGKQVSKTMPSLADNN